MEDFSKSYNQLSENSEWEQLRKLILGIEDQSEEETEEKEVEEKDDKKSSVSNKFANDISTILPEAVKLSTGKNSNLTKSLSPVVTNILNKNVKENPKEIADALFPIMGPAIRKSISETFRKMIQSFNETLESSLSSQSIKWRFQAVITGKPFAEIVLLKSLLYRVDQVFLIHRKSGILIQHAASKHIKVQDGDMVSGMLNAIKSFVEDSFDVSEENQLETIQVGEHNIWIEQGPHALIAAVVRGNPPESFREELQDTIEKIHAEHAVKLYDFQGNTEDFESTELVLKNCLKEEKKEEEKKEKKKGKPIGAYVSLGIILLAIITIVIFRAQSKNKRNDFLEHLDSEPGIVVANVSKENGKLNISGLRDPLSLDPYTIANIYNIDSSDISFRWEYYNALTPEFIAYRAGLILKPGDDVELIYNNGILYASGISTRKWVEMAKIQAPAIDGVNNINTDAVVYSESSDLTSIIEKIESSIISFDLGNTTISPEQDNSIDSIVDNILQLRNLAASLNQEFTIIIEGHTDDKGTEDLNNWISIYRAKSIADILIQKGISPILLEVIGMGSSQPLAKNTTENLRKKNRRVSFKVSLTQ